MKFSSEHEEGDDLLEQVWAIAGSLLQIIKRPSPPNCAPESRAPSSIMGLLALTEFVFPQRTLTFPAQLQHPRNT